jgi:hypothetical protein
MQVKTKSIVGIAALALGVATLVMNPRIRNDEDTSILISCTTRQMIWIDKGQDTMEDFEIPTGVYSVKTLTKTAHDGMIASVKEELAGNPFGGWMISFIEELGPTIESAFNNALDQACAFENSSFRKKNIVSQMDGK